jgi:hypothetical protein
LESLCEVSEAALHSRAMRLAVAAVLLALAGCSQESGEGMLVTFPDPDAGDRLVDGVWRGERSYRGPLDTKVIILSDEKTWPCEQLVYSKVSGRAAPWNMDHVVDGKISFRGEGCDVPIKTPYTLRVDPE